MELLAEVTNHGILAAVNIPRIGGSTKINGNKLGLDTSSYRRQRLFKATRRSL